ncbi:MAG: transporter [Naasia sp.]|uniref:MFS transporter n=1 Tax=Naasia sp. TaxID=2546198 RepID=UPI0026201786|nr:MFS transporter [Naasia sp.]MCU1569484.1 transporter [Naasia sp.]
MSSYVGLVRTPGVARIMGAQLLARFPSGMLSLGFLLHIERTTGSYAAAGLVLAALSAGQAISGPLTSRLMGIFGMRPVILATVIACSLTILELALVEQSVPASMAVALLAGLTYPPIQPAVRTIYPKMVNSRQLTPLFSLDASAQELIWVGGPVLVTFVSTQIGTVQGILLSVVLMAGGGAWFLSSPELGRVRIPRSRRRFGQVLTRPTVLLATVVGFLLIGSCAAIETGIVAVFGDDGPEAGIVLAIWSIGSLAGGLLLGHIPIGPWALARRVLIVTVGLALAAFALNFWWLALTLVISGLGLAPALAVIFAITSSSVKFSDTAEAYGWVGTGQLIGAALGSAAAGFLIDQNGAIGAFWVAITLASAGLLAAVIGKRWHPDLRHRDASPLPDTDAVPVQPS